MGRSDLTASWAAATERLRPTERGITTPGNSTVLRTGSTITASSGISGTAAGAAPPSFSSSLMASSGHPGKAQDQAAVDHFVAVHAKAPGR